MTERKKPAHTYKVGERVRLTRPPNESRMIVGTMGVVSALFNNPTFPLKVDWGSGLDNAARCFMRLSEIEPATPDTVKET